ncbi:MAG: YraN family protein [Planctomycetales bacterium]|nr:YraN family protein [Planctomycetales bacterium]
MQLLNLKQLCASAWARGSSRLAVVAFDMNAAALRLFSRRPAPLGTAGEMLAERHLISLGMKVIGRQVQMDWGELDLVAVENGVIVFVEVKTRQAGQIEDAVAAVTPDKQLRVARLAAAFLRRHDLVGRPVRFDVIAIAWSPASSGQPEIRHFRDAFQVPSSLG